jgi:LPS export ABC transporter permease LptG/LPS export ABC transporter permease LptF
VFTRIDRYILAETIGPIGLGFGVYTFLLLLRFLFRSAELIIRLSLPASEVGLMLAYTLPNVLVLTIPMALLFGILIAVGRLSADSELTALRACGVSLFSLYRPIMVLSALLTAINVVLMVWAVPAGNQALSRAEIKHGHALTRSVEARTFRELNGFTFYVFDIPPADRSDWRGVFVAPPEGSDQSLVVATRGRVEVDEEGDRLLMNLEGAQIHEISPTNPDRYQITERSRVEVPLREGYLANLEQQITVSKSVRLMNLAELRSFAADPKQPPELRRLAQVEVHKKFAIPAACLVFGLFAMPLGFNNRRGGRSSGFAISIGVILVYYVLLSYGEDAARAGNLDPLFAMWLPNLLFAIAGVVILARRNRDKSLLASRLDRWLRSLQLPARRGDQAPKAAPQPRPRSTRRPAAGPEDPELAVVLRVPRLRLPFPDLVDRYVIGRFIAVFIPTMLSGLVIYVIADLTEIADKVLQNKPGRAVVAAYYRYLSLQISYEILPIMVLVATLITFAVMSRANEVTAFKALGVSLYRLAIPALVAALALTLLAGVVQDEILPASTQKVAELKDQINGRTVPRTFIPSRQWIFGSDGSTMYHYLQYDPTAKRMTGLEVFQFDEARHLRRRIQANEATWDGSTWLLDDGWVRELEGSRVTKYETFDQPISLAAVNEPPAYFAADQRKPQQMSASELRRHIQALEKRGEQALELEVELHDKKAYPFSAFVMALVALPFGFRLERKGALYGLGVALVLGMAFVATYAFFTTLGTTGAIPPWVATWSPSAVFGLLSVYLFLGVRT